MPNASASNAEAISEAQASGMPIIMAGEGSHTQAVVPAETGTIVQPGKVKALVEAMETLIRDSARREAMGRAARQYIETHGFQYAFEPMWRIYSGAQT